MKKLVVLLFILFPFVSFAQWIDVSAAGGVAPYKISAGIKNSTSGVYNASISFVKLKFIDFGVQFEGATKLTLSHTTTVGAFADIVVMQDDDKENIVSVGIHGGYMAFGDIPKGGAYFKDGSIDTFATTTVDRSISYGFRIGYKRKLTDHIYLQALFSPAYTMSTIRYDVTKTNTCAVLYLPVMLGLSVRL